MLKTQVLQPDEENGGSVSDEENGSSVSLGLCNLEHTDSLFFQIYYWPSDLADDVPFCKNRRVGKILWKGEIHAEPVAFNRTKK